MRSGRGGDRKRGGGTRHEGGGGPHEGVLAPHESGGAEPGDEERLAHPLWRDQGALLEGSEDGLAIAEAEGAILWCNMAFARLYGYKTPEELLGPLSDRSLWSLYPTSDRRRLRKDLRTWGSGGESRWRAELTGTRRDAGTFPQELRVLRLDSGRLALTVRDLAVRRRRERALASREQLFRLLADHTTDLIALHEPDGSFVYVSPSVRRLLGYGRRELLGSALWELAHAEDVEQVRRCLEAAASGEASRATYRARHQTGSYRWLETTAQPIRSRRTVSQIQTSSRDVTERKELEQALEYQALHDPLTGLPNRSLFMNRLEQARARARRRGTVYGVLFLDLDGFKRVNDTLGHLAGDELLRAIARRLERWVRETDSVARLGGDEFAILLEGLESPDAVPPLVERIRQAFAEPFALDDQELRVGASIGVAVSGRNADSCREMIRRADEAMYSAKRADARGA